MPEGLIFLKSTFDLFIHTFLMEGSELSIFKKQDTLSKERFAYKMTSTLSLSSSLSLP